MIEDPSTTTTWPDMSPGDGDYYTLDEAYLYAQTILWSAFFGLIFNWALFSCLCIQMWFYTSRFKKENVAPIRYIVWLLFIIECFSTGYLTWTTYVQIIKNWGHDPTYNPSAFGMLFFDCSITSIVHGLYVWRIYSLFTKESLSPTTRYQMYGFVLLIGALSLCQFSCCAATSFFEALQYHQGPEKQFIARKLFHAWLASAAIADIIITVVLVWKLNSIRTKLGVKATEDKIKKILYIIVPAGAATAIFQILIWVLQATYPGVAYYQFLIFSLSKIYSNSVILSLNLRDNKQQQVDYDDIVSEQSAAPGYGFTTFDVSNDVHRQSSQPGHTEDCDEKCEKGVNRKYSSECNPIQESGLQGSVEMRYGPSSFPSSFLPSTNKNVPLSSTTPPARPQECGYYAPSKSSLQSTSSVALGNSMGRIGQLNAAQQSEHFDYLADSICFPGNVRTTTTTTTSPKIPSSPANQLPNSGSSSPKISYSPKSSPRPLHPPPISSEDTVVKGSDGSKANPYAA